jgi:putative FmdB family regulatory protein
MPIYEFECTACGAIFDRLQKLSDADPTHCPECARESIKRRLTAPSFRLAGSGWYETDFKKEGDTKRNLVGKDEAPVAKVETKEAPKVETPTAPAAPAKPKGGASDA